MGILKVGIDMKFTVPDYSKKAVDPLIEEISTKIANDVKKNIRNQTDFEDNPFARLAKKTVRNKIAKKSALPNVALVDKGILLRGITTKREASARHVVFVKGFGSPRRDDVAVWQQVDGVNQITRTIRKFLGVSKETERWIQERTLRFFENLKTKTVPKTKRVRVGG